MQTYVRRPMHRQAPAARLCCVYTCRCKSWSLSSLQPSQQRTQTHPLSLPSQHSRRKGHAQRRQVPAIVVIAVQSESRQQLGITCWLSFQHTANLGLCLHGLHVNLGIHMLSAAATIK